MVADDAGCRNFAGVGMSVMPAAVLKVLWLILVLVVTSNNGGGLTNMPYQWWYGGPQDY